MERPKQSDRFEGDDHKLHGSSDKNSYFFRDHVIFFEKSRKSRKMPAFVTSTCNFWSFHAGQKTNLTYATDVSTFASVWRNFLPPDRAKSDTSDACCPVGARWEEQCQETWSST